MESPSGTDWNSRACLLRFDVRRYGTSCRPERTTGAPIYADRGNTQSRLAPSHETTPRVHKVAAQGVAEEPKAERMADDHGGAPRLRMAHPGDLESSRCRSRLVNRAIART